MLLEVVHAVVAPACEIMLHPSLHALGAPVVERASLSIPDTLFLFVVALVVFGPKRLPEIGKQIGKLVFEFRRASNDFKLQIEEELRLSDQQERQKKLEMQAAAAAANPPVVVPAEAMTLSAPIAESGEAESNHAKPLVPQAPSSGAPVEAQPPNRFRNAPEQTVDLAESTPAESTTVAKVEAGLEQAAPAESAAISDAEGSPAQHG